MDIEFIPGTGRLGLPCWIALPTGYAQEPIPLVLVHGISRQAKEQLGLLAERACKAGRPIIAPEFSKENWRSYQQLVKRGRADLALLGLMQKMRAAGIWQTRKFQLAGYSGGAQFSHRFAMMYPHLISRLTVAAAGWYTFPDGVSYPYGMGDSTQPASKWGKLLRTRLHEFLSLPIEVVVGEFDHIVDDVTRSAQEIDKQQGTNRFERAQNWVKALHSEAKNLGICDKHITFQSLKRSGHNFSECVRHGGLDQIILPESGGYEDNQNSLTRVRSPINFATDTDHPIENEDLATTSPETKKANHHVH